MQFRDLKKQYQVLKKDMDAAMLKVAEECNFISGAQVAELEQELAAYVGAKNCVSCANGTDAPPFTFGTSNENVSPMP